MGTDCKSAAFSFGGSNPPAPTKNSSIRTGYWSFCFSCFAKGEARVDSNSIDPPNSPAGKKAPVQQRRPLPAAEIGRSCWGCGQQDARAAQGTKQPLGAATRAPYTARLATSTRAHQKASTYTSTRYPCSPCFRFSVCIRNFNCWTFFLHFDMLFFFIRFIFARLTLKQKTRVVKPFG